MNRLDRKTHGVILITLLLTISGIMLYDSSDEKANKLDNNTEEFEQVSNLSEMKEHCDQLTGELINRTKNNRSMMYCKIS